MAKAKTAPSPEKGKASGKAKAAATPDPPVRRSPRKTVASARKVEAEETAKVIKRVSPATKASPAEKASPAKKAASARTSTVKKLANALKKPAVGKTATKAAAEAETTATKKAATVKAKSPAPKKSVSPAGKNTATASAHSTLAKKAASKSPAKSAIVSPTARGKPRKGATPGKSTPRPRGRPPKNASPNKVTKTKASPKKPATRKPSASKKLAAPPPQATSDEDDESSLEGLDDIVDQGEAGSLSSLDSLDDPNPFDLTSNHNAPTLSPRKNYLKARLTAGKGSKNADQKRNNGEPSRLPSPANRSKPASNATATASRSPSKGLTKAAPTLRKNSAACTRSRSQSPAKAAQTSPTRQASGAGLRGRSQKPEKSRSGSNTRRTSGASTRSRSKNLSKVMKASSPRKTSAAAARTLDAFPFDGGKDSVGTSMNASKASRSSPKKPSQSPRRSSSQSPIKKASQRPTKASAKSPTKKTASSPTKASARSPTRAPARSPTKAAPRRSSEDSRWDSVFIAADDYGKTLRKMEMKAYTAKKEGKVFRGVSPDVDDEDGARAEKQGVERMKAEFALRSLADGKEQRVREGYEGRGVDLDGEEDDGDDGDRAPEKASGRNKYPKRPSKSSSTGRKTSSLSQRQPPPPSPRRSQSLTRRPPRQMSTTADDHDAFKTRKEGEPSAPDRGAVHSVNNPELIDGTNKKNPFFETMPGPEYWHRNQPAYFTFRETPYMQQEISRQMNTDLRKGAGGGEKEPEKRRSGGFAGISNFFSSLGKSKDRPASSEQQPQLRKSPFALPDVADDRVNAMLQELNRSERKKRKASDSASPQGSPRRPRRMSCGNGSRSRSPPTYQMSGAL